MKTHEESREKPSKERVRQWLVDRFLHREPLPCAITIRAKLGWEEAQADMSAIAGPNQHKQGTP